MRTEILYVELKQNHSGPAWIGYGHFSKSGQSIYFNGSVFKKAKGASSNYFDVQTGDDYWISGVKKNGEDRHWAGSGKIFIDKSAVNDYLQITGQTTLPKSKFILVDLDNIPNKVLSERIEKLQKITLRNSSASIDKALANKKKLPAVKLQAAPNQPTHDNNTTSGCP